MIQLFDLIANSSIIIAAILAIILLTKFKHLTGLLVHVGIYIIVGSAIDIISTALYYQVENNLRFLHLFTFFEFVILSSIFWNLFRQYQSKINIFYTSSIITLLIILNSLFVQDIDTLNSYSSILSSVVLISYCIHYFVIILDKNLDSIEQTILKWFIICVFFLQCTTLIVMIFGGVILDISREAGSYIWSLRVFIIFLTKIILVVLFSKFLLGNPNLKTNE